jgi:hypothetical protein
MEKLSRPCPVCGTQNTKNAAVCQKCGALLTPAETDADILVFTPKGRAGNGAPRRHLMKKIPKAVWAVLLVAAIGAAALLAVSGAQSAAHSPEKAAEEFRTAMADGDFERLKSIAQPSAAGVAFTAKSVKPMFALYKASPDFRRSVDTLSLSGGGSTVLHLKAERHFLYSGYTVTIDPVVLTVRSNIASASVSCGDKNVYTDALESAEAALDGTSYTNDYPNLVRSDATLSGLLPGVYHVNAAYDASFGGHFAAETDVQLPNSREITLNFKYVSVYLWNTSEMDVQISVGKTSYGKLAPDMTLQLAPVQPDATVSALCQPDSGKAMTSSIAASAGYFEIHFAVGKVEILNDYDAQMNVAWDAKPYCAISAKSAYVVASVPVGTKLTCTLSGCDVFAPYDYKVAYDYDSICPIFALSEQSSKNVAAAIGDYLGALGSGESDAQTDLARGLQPILSQTGLTGADLSISDIAVDEVFDAKIADKSVTLHLNGSYSYTLPDGVTLPQQPDAGQTKPGDEQNPDAAQTPTDQTPADQTAGDSQPAADGTADNGSTDTAASQPITQRFNATVVYDGENWTIQG